MADRKKTAEETQGGIQRILVQEWDPIDVRGIPEAKDEYDDYVGGVCRLLATGASPQEVAEHLAEIEVTTMGLPRRPIESVLPIAEKLCRLDVRLERKTIGARRRF